MTEEEMRKKLYEKDFVDLIQIRADQYTGKEPLIEDIIANDDDGSVKEMLAQEGSFLWLMVRGRDEGIRKRF
jgi:hypothetical protein